MNEAVRHTLSKIAKVITIIAIIISTLWSAAPFLLYFMDIKAEHYRHAFLGLFASLLAIIAFIIYNKKAKLEALLACHALLCVCIILSSAAWVGIPFMDLSYYLSVNIFGIAFILFATLFLIVVLQKRIRRANTTGPNS